jgi:hypothetical protein
MRESFSTKGGQAMRDRRWNISPAALVIVIAMVLMVGAIGGRFMLSPRLGPVDAHVLLEQGNESLRRTSTRAAPRGPVLEGEVPFTADRLREAAAVSVAGGLYAATERMGGRRIAGVVELLTGMTRAGLLPPGLKFAEQQPGVLVSERGTLYVRYRPEPLGIEVVSVGSKRTDGPMMLLRVPDESEGVYYRALRLDGVPVPAPFVPAAEVVAQGWTREELRGMQGL